MRGDIILKVLESIEDASLHFFDVFNAFLRAGYGASFWKMEREFEKIKTERSKRQFDQETAVRLKQKYSVLIYKLKKDGLIKEGTENGEKTFSITNKGKSSLLKTVRSHPRFLFSFSGTSKANITNLPPGSFL